MDKKFDGKLLKKYVDAYGLLNDQMNIINECATTLVNADKMHCKTNLEKLERARQFSKK